MTRWRLCVALGLALFISCGSCGDAPKAALQFSWVLVDGRSCADAGAPSVTVSYAGQSGNYRCSEGLLPGFEMLQNVSRDGTLTVQALSADNTELYRGDIDLSSAGPAATVTLYVSGSR